MSDHSDGESPWRRGRLDDREGPPMLLFGRMYEDAALEVELLPRGAIFCIASAGCTALALAARGDRVTAVDVNPAQVDYLRARLDGAPARDGTVDRMIALGHRRRRSLGLGDDPLRDFLSLADPAAQIALARARPDADLWRSALAGALSPLVERSAYGAAFGPTLTGELEDMLSARLERGWARHANRNNPYAWRLLLGEESPSLRASDRLPDAADARAAIDCVCADAADFLAQCAPRRFAGFSLSNLADASTPVERDRLARAVRRAAAPGAIAISRSFAAAENEREAEHAAQDRALLWGRILVENVG